MALNSRPSIPEVIFERIKSDLTEFAFNFFQDGISLDVSARTYRIRLKSSGIQALDKASTTNSAGRVVFTLLNSEKATLNASEYQFFLVEILAGDIENTLMGGSLRWSVPFGKTTGLQAPADVSVNYIAATQELMVALGVVDLGSSSSAASAAQAQASLNQVIELQNDVLSAKEDIDTTALAVQASSSLAQAAASQTTLDRQATADLLEQVQTTVDETITGVGVAEPGDSPLPNIKIVNVSTAGTYTNFSGVVVSSGDISSGFVQLRLKNGIWTKFVIPLELGAYLTKSAIAKLRPNQLFYPNAALQNQSIISNTGQPDDGTIKIPQAGQWWSGYIAVDPSKLNISKTLLTGTGVTNGRFYFYNSSFGFISKTNTGLETAPIPPTAAYVAFIIAITADHFSDADLIMVNYGTSALPLPAEKVKSISGNTLIAEKVTTDLGDITINEYLTAKGYLLPNSLLFNSYVNKSTDISYTDRTQLFKPNAAFQNQSIISNTGQPDDGTIKIPQAGQWWSGYIEIDPTKLNIAKTFLTGTGVTNGRFYFYNASFGFISKTNTGLITAPIPATAKYVAFIMAVTSDHWTDANLIMLNYGTVPLPYVSYDTETLFIKQVNSRFLSASKLVTELGDKTPEEYLIAKGLITSKPVATLFKPAKIYSICNDTRPTGAGIAADEVYSTDFTSSIYIDHLFNLTTGQEMDAYVKENGTDRFNFSSPKSLDSNGTPVYNNSVDISTVAKSFTIAGDYADQLVSLSHISTKASYQKSKPVLHMRISDSTGEGTSTSRVDVAATSPAKIPDFMLVAMERLKVDAGAAATGDYTYKALGRKAARSLNFNYGGVTKTLNSYTESTGSWAAVDYYLYTDKLVLLIGQGVWDRLGLGNGTGTDYTGTLTQRSAILSTPEGKFAPINTAAFITHMNSVYGGITTYAQAVAKQNDLLVNPVNPFFDSSLTGVHRFSMAKYLARYKTIDPVTFARLVVGSTAGTAVTNVNDYDVCKPTHVTISLGTNDQDTPEYIAAISGMVTEIKAYDSNIIVLLAMIDVTGTYFPKKYPKYQITPLYNNYSGHNKATIFNQRLMALENIGSRIIYLPSFFVQPTAEGVPVKKTPRAKSLSGLKPEDDFFYVEWGKNPVQHPNAVTGSELGVHELGAVLYTKQFMP